MPELKPVTPSPNAGFYRDVLFCTIPLLMMSYVLYGPRPVILAAVSYLMAYVCDRLLAPLHGPDYDSGELSSECFAVLLTLLMPPNISAYVLAIAVLTAVVVKEIFGGAGNYPFNPAAVGYSLVAVAWPQEVFRYPALGKIPITGTGTLTLYDSASATLRNGGLPNLSNVQLLVGNYAGPLGAGFTLILIGCGAFLLLRKRIRLTTILSFLFACLLVVWILPRAGTGDMPLFSLPWTYLPQRLTVAKYELLTGATLFAALFLICEPVTHPRSRSSQIVYGFFLGILTMMIRYFGAYEIGACFAILILNALSDRLDLTVEKILAFLARRKAKTPAPAHAASAAVPQAAPAVQAKPASAPAQPAAPARANPAAAQTAPAQKPAAVRQAPAPKAAAPQQAAPKTAAQPAAAPKAAPAQQSAPRQAAPKRVPKKRFADDGLTLMIPSLKNIPTAQDRKEDSNGDA